jgi:hypothetical protein
MNNEIPNGFEEVVSLHPGIGTSVLAIPNDQQRKRSDELSLEKGQTGLSSISHAAANRQSTFDRPVVTLERVDYLTLPEELGYVGQQK